MLVWYRMKMLALEFRIPFKGCRIEGVARCMRILLDSRDLIEVAEHQNRVTTRAFNSFLRDNNHELVLCASTVREISGPLAHGASFIDTIRPILQAIETLPIRYLREVDLFGVEIQAALNAFENDSIYEPPNPYVRTYPDTLAGPGLDGGLPIVGLRLDAVIYEMYRSPYRDRIFGARDQQLAAYRRIMIQERELLRNGHYRARLHFANVLPRHAATHHARLPANAAAFIDYVYVDADRCPGFRIYHEVFRSLARNLNDNPEAGDFVDLALISAIPYVDAVTLDRRMRTYVEQAARKMLKVNAAVNYRDRVYEDVSELMRRV
jgi:hypothetical protein